MPQRDSYAMNGRSPLYKTGKILLVEDEPVNQAALKAFVQKCGYEVDIAQHGAEALVLLDRGKYALILMDCQMPVLNGYEATIEIRRREAKQWHAEQNYQSRFKMRIPIIGIPAHGLPQDREKCMLAGMDDFFSKPTSLTHVRVIIQRWIMAEPSTHSIPLPATLHSRITPMAQSQGMLVRGNGSAGDVELGDKVPQSLASGDIHHTSE